MNPMQIIQMAAGLRNNPMSMLGNLGVPQNIINDPQQVIQHLMNKGNISQDQYNAAIKQAQQMGFKI